MPTATHSYYPCLRRPPRGWRRLAFECGAIFSVLLYTGDTSCRRWVTDLQSYIQLKSAYTSSFRQLKSAIRRSCMYGAHTCTVTHGLSVRKEKERIAKKRCTGGGVPLGVQSDSKRPPSAENFPLGSLWHGRLKIKDLIGLNPHPETLRDYRSKPTIIQLVNHIRT